MQQWLEPELSWRWCGSVSWALQSSMVFKSTESVAMCNCNIWTYVFMFLYVSSHYLVAWFMHGHS